MLENLNKVIRIARALLGDGRADVREVTSHKILLAGDHLDCKIKRRSPQSTPPTIAELKIAVRVLCGG